MIEKEHVKILTEMRKEARRDQANAEDRNDQEFIAVFKADVSALDFALSTIERSQWVAVEERLPDVGQNIAFVVTDSHSSGLNGRVLGGRFSADGYFSVPGIGFQASHWMPLPDAPFNPQNEWDEIVAMERTLNQIQEQEQQ